MYKALTSKHSTSPRARLDSLAREQTEAALNMIISVMNEPTVDARTRLMAAAMLLDRGWGKPTQLLEHGSPEGAPIRRIIREIVHVTETREQLENADLVVDFDEIKALSNGSERRE